jgi:hypothetical protein
LLLAALAAAATLEPTTKHVFAGEEFTVTFTTAAPLSQHKATFDLEGQKQEVVVPTLTSGVYKFDVVFKAPTRPGKYTIKGSDVSAEINVEEPLLILEDAKLDPPTVRPREAARLSFRVTNPGKLSVYNVKSRVTVLGGSGDFIYNADEEELASVFQAGEAATRVVEITPKEGAAGTKQVSLVVTYEFDNEIHSRSALETISVSGFPWVEVVIIALILILVGRLALARFLGA